MYNKVILMGRITKDLEMKTTQAGTPVMSFSIAVDRSYQAKGEERKTDFINIVAWNKTAEFISRFFTKGSLILIEGELQTRQYKNKDGVNITVTEVIADNARFTGEKRARKDTEQAEPVAEQTTPAADSAEDYPF